MKSGQRSNRRDMWTEKYMSRLLLLCPLVTSIASLSTCHVYCFSVHLSRLLFLCQLVTSIVSLFTCHILDREAIDVTSGQRSNSRDKWTEK
jgi:hypothetical protein